MKSIIIAAISISIFNAPGIAKESSFIKDQFEGSYSYTEAIVESTTGREVDVESKIEIRSMGENEYLITGIIYGGNLHVCHLNAVMKKIDGKLHFAEEVLIDNQPIQCEFTIEKLPNNLLLKDPGGLTSKYIFHSGVRASANQVEFPLASRKNLQEALE